MMETDPAPPVEAKVKAATGAAAVAGLLVWLLEEYVFGAAAPEAVEAAVDVLVPAAAALVAGWLARHTPRIDLAALQAARDRAERQRRLDDPAGE